MYRPAEGWCWDIASTELTLLRQLCQNIVCLNWLSRCVASNLSILCSSTDLSICTVCTGCEVGSNLILVALVLFSNSSTHNTPFNIATSSFPRAIRSVLPSNDFLHFPLLLSPSFSVFFEGQYSCTKVAYLIIYQLELRLSVMFHRMCAGSYLSHQHACHPGLSGWFPPLLPPLHVGSSQCPSIFSFSPSPPAAVFHRCPPLSRLTTCSTFPGFGTNNYVVKTHGLGFFYSCYR